MRYPKRCPNCGKRTILRASGSVQCVNYQRGVFLEDKKEVEIVNLHRMTNRQLYDEWTDAAELLAREPYSALAKRREDQCMSEIIRRMQEASLRPLVRQEA
jgi:hypothetical protein